MKQDPIYVTQPFLPPKEEFLPYLEKIWNSKQLTNGGNLHQELEKQLSDYLEVSHISLFSNATIALMTALKLYNLSGEIITTPFSFAATAQAIDWNNCKPVFVDVEEGTFNIDPSLIEEKITDSTSAILPVHVYGTPCNVEEISNIALNNNLKVIYDAAHSFGINYKGKSLLTFGDLSVLSFHATKVFNTFEGGAIISKDIDSKEQIDEMKNFSLTENGDIKNSGLNGKLSEIHAAMGLLQLKYIEFCLNQRKCVSDKYDKAFKDILGISITQDDVRWNRNYSYYPISIDKEVFNKSRDDVFENLKSNSVFSRKYFYPSLNNMTYFKTKSDDLNLSSKFSTEILCLPIYPDLKPEEQERVIEIILK